MRAKLKSYSGGAGKFIDWEWEPVTLTLRNYLNKEISKQVGKILDKELRESPPHLCLHIDHIRPTIDVGVSWPFDDAPYYQCDIRYAFDDAADEIGLTEGGAWLDMDEARQAHAVITELRRIADEWEALANAKLPIEDKRLTWKSAE